MFEFRDVDTGDEAQLRQWYDVWRASQPHRRADLIPSWAAAGRARFFPLFSAREASPPPFAPWTDAVGGLGACVVAERTGKVSRHSPGASAQNISYSVPSIRSASGLPRQ